MPALASASILKNRIPDAVRALFPHAVIDDLILMVRGFYEYRLAISEGYPGHLELIMFNRLFSKVDSTQFEADRYGQTRRYTEVVRLLMLQLAHLFADAVNDYEKTRLECTQLIAAHDEELRALEARVHAASDEEKEDLLGALALMSINFIQQARALSAKMQACKERIKA